MTNLIDLIKMKAKGEEDGRRQDVRQHHQLSGQELEQTLGDSEGQGSLACYSPWSHKESDTTELLN